MTFRTTITPPVSEAKITLHTPVLSIGSCFSQIIGGKLRDHKFRAEANPFGVLYNPLSIFQCLTLALNRQMPGAGSYIENQGVHYNYYFHSDISALSKKELEQKTENTIGRIHAFIKEAGWLMITLGTAFVFTRNDSGQPVGNCHKMPQKLFTRKFLEMEDILEAFDAFHTQLVRENPGIRIVFTVSPVRHVRDTLIKNSVSKAVLRLACEKITGRYPNTIYFPSYELMIDDLRDYRFYASDMLHPNELSERYVWEKFAETYLDEEARRFIKEWEQIRRALAHKPFYPELPAHQHFISKTIEKLNSLKNKVNVESELSLLKKQLK